MPTYLVLYTYTILPTYAMLLKYITVPIRKASGVYQPDASHFVPSVYNWLPAYLT